MKNVVHNLRDGSRYQRIVLLVPTLLLPIAAMGVTTPSYLTYRDAVHQESVAQEGFEYARSKQSEWRSLGSIESRMADLSEMNEVLTSLIPGWQEELVVHGAVRDAARYIGMELTRIQMSEPERLGEAVEGQVVVERGVALTAEGNRDSALQLVDRLRSQGWPTCVHSMDANADHSGADRFGYELRLGLFHYAPAEDFVITVSDEEEGIPTLEEPIE